MNRTVIAAILTTAALAIPLAAWYVVGSRDAERAGEDLARGLAEKLALRLEDLREIESLRPFYHYDNLYHDPEAAAEGPAIVSSPLAEGPLDPFILTNFQVDAQGAVTLPTINDEVPERNRPEEIFVQRRIQQVLTGNNKDYMAAARKNTLQADATDASPPSQLTGQQLAANWPMNFDQQLALQQFQGEQQQKQEVPMLQGGQIPAQPQQQASANSPSSLAYGSRLSRSQARYNPNIQTIDQEDMLMNAQASRIYQDLKQRKESKNPKGKTAWQARKPVAAPQGKVQIRTEPLRWCTVPFGQGTVLAALREVTAPAGLMTQGILISTPAVEAFLQNPVMPVRFRPGRPAGDGEVRIPIPGADWTVAVDSTGSEIVGQFRTTFGLGAAAVILAGCFVVGLVWQSERLARQRSRFAASAAHELRTPLAGLRMYGEMLAEGLGDPGRSKDYARRVADEAERLGRVVSNVLGFSRLERGALQVRPEPGDLGAAVRECVERQRPALEALDASVNLSVEEGLPPARFDRDAIAQILQNLLDNAEKYARGASDRSIRVAVTRADGGAAVAVEDRGPGITPEIGARLFQPFARGGGTDAPAGLGLGLAIARALARAQGGSLDHATAEGGGARFVVTLPS